MIFFWTDAIRNALVSYHDSIIKCSDKSNSNQTVFDTFIIFLKKKSLKKNA